MGRLSCRFRWQARGVAERGYGGDPPAYGFTVQSLVTMLKTALLKTKGRFDEEELRAVFAEHGMDVPSAKRFIGSLLESRTEEGRSVSYISSVKKKESNELSFTVTKGFDLLLSRYQSCLLSALQALKASVCSSIALRFRFEYAAQSSFYARLSFVQRRRWWNALCACPVQ